MIEKKRMTDMRFRHVKKDDRSHRELRIGKNGAGSEFCSSCGGARRAHRASGSGHGEYLFPPDRTRKTDQDETDPFDRTLAYVWLTNNADTTHIVIEAEAKEYEQLGYFMAAIKTGDILRNVKSTSGIKTESMIKVTIEGDLP